jgi:hypothetical protein
MLKKETGQVMLNEVYDVLWSVWLVLQAACFLDHA